MPWWKVISEHHLEMEYQHCLFAQELTYTLPFNQFDLKGLIQNFFFIKFIL